MSIVLERANKGLCPICAIPITTEFKVEEYNGKKVWMCKQHPVRDLTGKGGGKKDEIVS